MSTQPAPDRNIQRITLPIYNLSCGGGGSLTIERILAHTPGVVAVYVNPATEMAYISYDADQCTREHLTLVIAQAGFGPRGNSQARTQWHP